MIVKQQSLSHRVVIVLFVLLPLTCAQLSQVQAAPLAQLQQNVIVYDQNIVASQVIVEKVVTAQDGWIAIYRSQAGKLDDMIGLAPVPAGVNTNVAVPIDAALATAMLYILLLSDAGQRGVYEFPGADSPIIVSNPPILAFRVTGLPPKPAEGSVAPDEAAQAPVTAQSFGLYLPLVSYTVTLQGVVMRSANLRAGPGLTFAIEGSARARQAVVLIACDETCSWYRLADGTWISASLVQAVSDASSLLPHVIAQ